MAKEHNHSPVTYQSLINLNDSHAMDEIGGVQKMEYSYTLMYQYMVTSIPSAEINSLV